MTDNHIITQINKKRTRPRRVTGTFLGILYQIKKAPANAEARPLLPWYPCCSVRGGDILLLFYFCSWSINYISVQSSKYWSSTH
nr:MAG TPA: hypothetical protein [Caudoviricetes sp.]